MPPSGIKKLYCIHSLRSAALLVIGLVEFQNPMLGRQVDLFTFYKHCKCEADPADVGYLGLFQLKSGAPMVT